MMAIVHAADERAMLERTDAADWNVRDHLAHLSAWLHSVIVIIRDGQPQWTGLGAPKELYKLDDYDPLNEAIWRRTIDWSLTEVLAEFTSRHQTAVEIIQSMSDKDLLKPVSDFVAVGEDVAICYKLDGNGPYHYREHWEWIEQILA